MGQCLWGAAALRTTIPVPDCACRSVVSLLPTFVSPCGSKARTDETPPLPGSYLPLQVRSWLPHGRFQPYANLHHAACSAPLHRERRQVRPR